MQLNLRECADFLEKHKAARGLFIILSSAIAIGLIGYHYGSFDQSVHIPFLKSMADPQLYPHDPFLRLKENQFSFFWYFFLPIINTRLFEVGLFTIHFFTVAFFLHAIWTLAADIFQEPLAGFIAVLGFIIPHTGFVGFPAIEFSLLSRTFVLPFLMTSLSLFLKERYWASFLLLGLMYNLNLLMVNFMFLAILISFCVNKGREGLSSDCWSPAFFLVGAFPVLAWKFFTGTGIDWSMRPEWFTTITKGALYQIFYLITDEPILFLTIGGMGALVLFFIANAEIPDEKIMKKILTVMWVLIGLVVSQIPITHFFPATFLIQLQISRASLYILIISYVCFAGYLARWWKRQANDKRKPFLTTGVFILGLTPLFPLTALFVEKKFAHIFTNRKLVIVLLTILCLGNAFMMNHYGLWQPGIWLHPRSSDWMNLQEWVKENTEKDALFITPPHQTGLYESDWRVFSERGTIVTMYDLFETALKPEYFFEYAERIDAVAPRARLKFNNIFFENRKIVMHAYNNLTSDQIDKIRCKYGASYIVLEKPGKLTVQSVYENDTFQLIKLDPEADCHQSS